MQKCTNSNYLSFVLALLCGMYLTSSLPIVAAFTDFRKDSGFVVINMNIPERSVGFVTDDAEQ